MGKVKPCKDGEVVNNASVSAPIVDHLRKIVCIKCGKTFNYRGIEDDEALELGCGICTECQRSFKGGTYDGMAVGDLYNN